jgi:hypothetical protein
MRWHFAFVGDVQYTSSQATGKRKVGGKGKGHSITGHKYSQREQRYSSTSEVFDSV